MINEKLTRSKKRKAKKKDACYHKVKSRYSVWPSAYASGALVKCRKKGAKNWGKGRKDEALHTAYFNFGLQLIDEKRRPTLAQKKRTQARRAAGKEFQDSDETLMRGVQSGPSLISRASQAYKKFKADREERAEAKAIEKGEKERRDAEQKKYLAAKKAEEAQLKREDLEAIKAEKARQKRVKQFGKNRKKVEARRLQKQKEEAEARRLENQKEKDDSTPNPEPKEPTPERSPEQQAAFVPKGDQQRSDRKEPEGERQRRAGTKPRPKQKTVIIRRNRPGAVRSFLRGRRSQLAKRPKYDFSHTEYQRIGAILAEAKGVMPKKFSVKSGDKSAAGGLTAKGVKRYRAANPGSKLKTAVTTKPSKLKKGSKSAKRRKSFCARMGGMKKRLTSSKTANDPNSRINKALRKWNC